MIQVSISWSAISRGGQATIWELEKLRLTIPLFSCRLTQMNDKNTPDVSIHYLGHAAFILRFGNGLSILTDYGVSNAYGLDSPIYDIEFQPDIVTYSHTEHVDHCRVQPFEGVLYTLTEPDSLKLEGLVIEPIPTCEQSLDREDNTSYLFSYKGLTVLHLGDAQSYITHTDQEQVRKRIKAAYPQTYDLLLMPIGWVKDIIPEAEAFIDLLQPRRVIPMHYWSPAYKAEFMAYLATQTGLAGKHYHIQTIQGPDYSISARDDQPIQVISLEAGPL
jgi:L-ascorbate metabolism protein UlaG (beta-lactamase superfamily)